MLRALDVAAHLHLILPTTYTEKGAHHRLWLPVGDGEK